MSAPIGYINCPRCGGTGLALDPVHLGLQARKRREGAKVTLRELARRVGLGVAYLSDLELGRRSLNAELIERLNKALGSDVHRAYLRGEKQ